MTIRDLIEKLKQYDLDDKVKVAYHDRELDLDVYAQDVVKTHANFITIIINEE